MVRVVTAGHVNWDVTLRVDELPVPDGEAQIGSQRRSGGGSSANVAVALSRLGVESGLVGSVGTDEHGLLARRELEAAGVDTSHLLSVENAATTVKYLIVAESGEVMVLGNEGANERYDPADVAGSFLAAADHLHLTGQQPETAAALAAQAAEMGLSVSFDPGRRLAARDFRETLAVADVIFLNDHEAATILDADVESPCAELDCRVVVTKHGGDGASVHTTAGSYSHPGFGVDPVDTTGAGDSFAAGFLAQLLAYDDYERALEYANACGALASLAEGARTAPTRAEVVEFLAEQY